MKKTFDSFEQPALIIGGLLSSCLGLDYVNQLCVRTGDCCELVSVVPSEIVQEHEDCKPALYRVELEINILVSCEEQPSFSIPDELYCCLRMLKAETQIVSMRPLCAEKCKGWKLILNTWVRPHVI